MKFCLPPTALNGKSQCGIVSRTEQNGWHFTDQYVYEMPGIYYTISAETVPAASSDYKL